MHPELEEHFAYQRGRQQMFVRTAEVQRNVNGARDAAFRLLDGMSARGEAIGQAEQRAEELEAASAQFGAAAERLNERWWSRALRCACVPQWWCAWSAPPGRKE